MSYVRNWTRVDFTFKLIDAIAARFFNLTLCRYCILSVVLLYHRVYHGV